MKDRYTRRHARGGRTERLPDITVWENQYKRDYEIVVEVPEFTSICPKTKLPDFGRITIRYTPDAYCAELKSLKYYLLAYRNLGIFYENAVNRIMDDFVRCVRPKKVLISGQFNTRGGMNSMVEVKYPFNS